MKLLHILNDGPTDLSAKIIDEQKKWHEVRVIDLANDNISYEDLVDAIFSYDRVMSW